MSIQKIEYENKIGLQNDENVPNKNKVTDDDMNEIKETVNNNADELTNLQENQGIASGDITSLKNRVTTLETDNTTNKQDINTLKADNETNKQNIANKVDKVEGKGLSTEDFTAELKTKLEGLNNYDDTEIKEDIAEIQAEQATQNQKIEQLDDNQIHVTTEKSNNLNIQDASEQNAKIKLFGISKQEGTPSPEFPSKIENTTGDIDITVCNKNFFDENNTNNFKYGVGDDFTTKNDDGTFKTIANFSLGRNKGTKIVGLKANTDYIVSLDIKNITSTATSKAAEVEIIENAEKISIVMQKDFKNLGINTLEFNSGSYQDLSLHISGYTYSEVSKSVSVTFADVLIAEKSNDNSYVEHEQQTITFPLKENQKMYESSRTEDDGIHHKRNQIELDGTENWFMGSITSLRYSIRLGLQDIKLKTTNLTTGILSNCFLPDDSSENSIGCEDKFTFRQANGSKNLWFFVSKNFFTTTTSTEILAEWKAYLSAQKTAETPVVAEYEIEEETIEEYTEEQQTAYNQLQSAKTYKTVTNVFTENAELEMEYIADTKTYIDNKVNNMQNQLNTINELLSTTNTSALLLNNLQTDLESEVL